jgi:hypothetical protein
MRGLGKAITFKAVVLVEKEVLVLLVEVVND